MTSLGLRQESIARVVWTFSDAAVVFASIWLAAWLRYESDLGAMPRGLILTFALCGAGAVIVHSALVDLSGTRQTRGSFEETTQVAYSGAVVLSVLVVARFVLDAFPVARSIPFTGTAIALIGMFAVRFVVRSCRWGRGRGSNSTAVIVYGAGEGGRQVIRALTASPAQDGYHPVAILDDDPRKRRWRVEGVRVQGGLEHLEAVAGATGATTVVIAAPTMGTARTRQLHEAAEDLGLDLLTLPPVEQLLGPPQETDLRQLNLEDLLGRRRVDLDESAISQVVSGKRVLVTGAGGSIGSELCRQITKFGPAKLILLDRDESALHATQMSLTGRALLDDGTLALCDIRDEDALTSIFDQEQPEVVFHAAALKHLTLLELHPMEAWKSNVLGTLHVLRATRSVGVRTFVNISTDKAANPTCVLGYSKRMAERLTAAFAAMDDNVYVSVRFGNVLGSRGSVLGAFTAQIRRGDAITVTHPEAERYFMLIPEASQLVLQAAAMGRDGEVMVLDMGEPVKILDVAKTLIALSGKRGLTVEFTGLRPGEKLSEELFLSDETISPTAHPLVSRVSVPPLDPRATIDAPATTSVSTFMAHHARGTPTTVADLLASS